MPQPSVALPQEYLSKLEPKRGVTSINGRRRGETRRASAKPRWVLSYATAQLVS
jgi:hypothetical protein